MLAAQGLRGAEEGGVCPHTLPAPHLQLRGCTQLPARACMPGIWERRGGRLSPCPLTPRMIQTLFCFSSARRRGQPDGWRWLPLRDKAARLSRHNRPVRLLARPRGHGPGAGWVLVCPSEPPQPCWGSPGCSECQQRGRDRDRSQVSQLIPLPAPALPQEDTAPCPGCLPCPVPSLLTIQKYLGRPQHKLPLRAGDVPEGIAHLHPSQSHFPHDFRVFLSSFAPASQ